MKAQKNFVFIGRSGSGKGTQAQLLLEKFNNLANNLVYIQSGELFRNLANQDTATGVKVRKTLERGGLPSDDIATTLWMHEISFNVKGDQRFILDGAPRRVSEAQNLDRFLDFLEWRKDALFLLIDISRDEAFKRLMARGRLDDTQEAINGRLDYYDEITSNLTAYYEETGRLIRINGEQSVEAVHQDIMKAIG